MHNVEIGDLYCGAGGSSSGLVRAAQELAIPYRLTGVNHWNVAIASHSANHPGARHFLMEIEDAPADVLFPQGRLDVMWASPECTEHSYAKGGKSINDQRRANAWSIPRLAGELRPSVIIVENVSPFVKWGPVELLADGGTRPIADRKGETFREWFAAVEACGPGYRGSWRLLNAADYGEAQSRTRFFAVFVAPGVRFDWPEATHDKLGKFGRLKWEPARKIIDRGLPSTSIFERERPLSENTIARIAEGIRRFCAPGIAEAFLVVLRNHADVQSLDDAAPTITAGGTHLGLAEITAAPFVGRNQTHNVPRSLDEPVANLTTAHGGGLFLTEPSLEPFTLGQHGGGVARSIDEPVHTISTDGYVRVVEPTAEPFILPQNADRTPPRSLDETLPTVVTRSHHQLVEPFLTSYYGQGNGGAHPPRSLDDPAPTVVTANRFGLVEPFLIDVRHGEKAHRPRSVDEVVGTICTHNGLGVVEPFIVPQQGDGVASVEDPLGTIMTTSRGIRLVEPYLVAHFGERKGQTPRVHAIDEPVPTVTHRGAGDFVEPIVEPVLGEIPPELRSRVVFIDGVPYVLDIRFRMLQPIELKQFQGLPADYVLTGTKSDQTAQIGNAVSEKVAHALGRQAFAALGYGAGDEAAA